MQSFSNFYLFFIASSEPISNEFNSVMTTDIKELSNKRKRSGRKETISVS